MISFIIPTLNEEDNLPNALESIHKHLYSNYNYEIIVVDNGSTDDTINVAIRYNTKVIVKPFVTVAALRNLGVLHATGRVLVFLDADVILTDTWLANIPLTIDALKRDPLLVTGSRCGISKAGSWIERFWFVPLLTEKAKYINSGHLITTRTLFERIGGFSENLETGEDYDFSMKAKSINATILNNSDLYVIHEGYPKTLWAFVKREFWHGKNSSISLKSITRSKTSLLSILFVFAHISVIIGLCIHNKVLIIISLLSIILLCVSASSIKFRYHFRKIIINSFLYYCYFGARSISFLNGLVRHYASSGNQAT